MSLGDATRDVRASKAMLFVVDGLVLLGMLTVLVAKEKLAGWQIAFGCVRQNSCVRQDVCVWLLPSQRESVASGLQQCRPTRASATL
jgi:hypothetical protein